MGQVEYGLFGKLPLHGDFVHRNLPSNFITYWDEWLQHFVGGSKEQMGEQWLEFYLTSPIWRFVLSAGVIDEQEWAGLMFPSVDQVGRYYPFSVLVRLPGLSSGLEFIATHTNWYEQVEDRALRALEEEFTVDALLAELESLECNFDSGYRKNGEVLDSPTLQLDMEFEEQLPSSVYGYMLDSALKMAYRSYSVWTTQGSETLEPCIFSVQGLPAVQNLPAMLDGQWNKWGWRQPFVLAR